MITNKRSTSSRHFMFLFAFALLLLVPVMTAVAEIGPVRTSPTQAPTATMGAFQANPTQPPKPDPIDDFRARPTNTPTPRPPRGPDDLVANPTKAPEREIDDLVANPTKTPEREIDDIVANPTQVPGIDDVVANPGAGTVRVDKRDCPVGVVEDAILSEYLVICTEAHDGVEFTLDHGGESDVAVTASGEATWTGVLPGAFAIQETMPDGYGDPIVFCGFTESPGGGVQHPALKPSAGGLVTGALVQLGAEYVCFWMNIPDEPFVGIDLGSIANPGAGRDDGLIEATRRT